MSRNVNRIFFAAVFTMAGLMVAGCDGGGLTPNERLAANKQWNDARANVLASLALDQYKSGSLDKCQETLNQALHLEPQSASLHMLAAKLAIEQGKLEIAAAHLSDARKLDPKSGEADYLMGVVLQRWQQTQKACDAYAAAAEKDPTEIAYLLAEAETLVSLEQSERALTLLQGNAELFEHSGVLRDEIGQILVEQKKYDQAAIAFREASILSTDDASIREHLAFALIMDKQYGEAADAFDRLRKEPGYQKRGDLAAAQGECQAQLNELTDARRSYEVATQLNPSLSCYWRGLGRAAVQLNDLYTAETAVRKAISLNPNDADSMCLLGYVRLKESQLPQSLEAFAAAAKLDPNDSMSVCLQGYVLSRMGRGAEAKPYYQRALKINPQDELAGKLMAGVDLHD